MFQGQIFDVLIVKDYDIMKIHRLIAQILLADDYKFLKKTQVAFIDNVVARSALLGDFSTRW